MLITSSCSSMNRSIRSNDIYKPRCFVPPFAKQQVWLWHVEHILRTKRCLNFKQSRLTGKTNPFYRVVKHLRGRKRSIFTAWDNKGEEMFRYIKRCWKVRYLEYKKWKYSQTHVVWIDVSWAYKMKMSRYIFWYHKPS